MITIDISQLFEDTAKLSQLADYIAKAQAQAGEGQVVKLTGAGPVWLYLKLAHALHGKVTKLYYDSPASGEVLVFDHNPHG